ncbi:acetolactate synthase small subunit [Aliiglaciecola sp. 3_MG-2023]|uniref:acetolactate synthase small subunit n=1 Tax=Alteromonadaceae TaxID=72275 RepID=UPI001C0845A0|nr:MULTISPECIES: acetolactate synthase small subunit [Aliiglaciecola]MBU2878491.1 acetolactate synthase small subunit [Aliiglaciecola lipolytica]MDO6695706.1 acetolactate synthase small subunit [Aliiglaciecola sp. 3_MG-2023]MDO6709693.1 acetolactate synthase small subunit [Aliiglaciecola sp. 2_MG-2023]MDO6750765.1 acetolactate synthase small subunit [Aliiglaciecola sp. 1_MG-2023]
MRRIISVLMENEPGSLSRIVGVFSQRGYNVDSLCVAPTTDSSLSRLTIVTHGDDKVIEQITKQVNKLIDVLKVTDLTDGTHVERELMLIKVAAKTDLVRSEVNRTVDIFRAQIVDTDAKNYTIQVTGTSDKLDAFAQAMWAQTEVIESSRTGVCGLARGEKSLRV